MEELKDPSEYLSSEIRELLSKSKKEEQVDTSSQVNMLKIGVEYWSKLGSEYVTAYEKGEVISNYNSVLEFDHLNLFHSLSRIYYEVIREELIKTEIETTSLKDSFQLIDTSFKLLPNYIEHELKLDHKENPSRNNKLNVDLLFASLHGFINSYLNRKKLD